MSFPVEMFSLILYCVQQLGVVLGVGAQTIVLVSYLITTRDGKIEQKEEQFGRVVVQVLKWGLFFIILSGALITVMHLMAGQSEIVFTPAYIFKWILIGAIATVTLMVGKHPYMHFFWEGVLGAHWYALFILHVVAPLTTWPDLLVLYVLWTVGFLLAWNAFVYTMRAPAIGAIKKLDKIKAPAEPAAKKSSGLLEDSARLFSQQAPPPLSPKPTPPPQPKVIAPVLHKPEALPPPPLPAVIKPAVAVGTPPTISVPQKPPQKPAPTVPQKPIEDPDAHLGLPTIRVMPQTQQDVDKQTRGSVVQFDQQ